MSPIAAEFINTFGAFGLALVVFGMVACMVWSKMIIPTLVGKNKVQERYVGSLEALLENHKEASQASIQVQHETAETLAKIGQSLELGFQSTKRDHNQILGAITREKKKKG